MTYQDVSYFISNRRGICLDAGEISSIFFLLLHNEELRNFNYSPGINNPSEAEARLNNFLEFSSYLKENITHLHYKDRLVNAVSGNNRCLL
jgi:hypothetical protein